MIVNFSSVSDLDLLLSVSAFKLLQYNLISHLTVRRNVSKADRK